MESLAQDIRQFISRRIDRATLAEIMDLARTMTINDETPPARAGAAPAARFSKLDLRGRRLLDSESDWVAVYDAETNLMWTREVLECGDTNWKDAQTAARNMRLFGKEDWRAPTVKEQISIIDYSRAGPAVDTTYFSSYSGWCWTSTVDVSAPSDFAWFVYLQNGDVGRGLQTDRGSVRAVRAGQPLELEL